MSEQRLDEDTAPDAPSAPVEPTSVSARAETAPAPVVDELEKLLAQWDEGVQPAAAPEPEPVVEQQPAAPEPPARSADDFQVAYQRELDYQLDKQAGYAHIAKIQERIQDYDVPDDYAELLIRKMADEDPRLDVAWKARNVDPVACRVEFDRVQGLLRQAKANPSLASPQEIASAEQWLWQLQVAIHARTILRQTEEAVVKKARSRPKIDEQVSADRMAVANAVRGASGKVGEEPAPNFGQLSDAELKDYTRKNFGFV
jgi:hypothetical protein